MERWVKWLLSETFGVQIVTENAQREYGEREEVAAAVG